MENVLPQIALDSLDKVMGGKSKPKATGGDGDSIGRHDGPFQPIEDDLKGKTIGEG